MTAGVTATAAEGLHGRQSCRGTRAAARPRSSGRDSVPHRKAYTARGRGGAPGVGERSQVTVPTNGQEHQGRQRDVGTGRSIDDGVHPSSIWSQGSSGTDLEQPFSAWGLVQWPDGSLHGAPTSAFLCAGDVGDASGDRETANVGMRRCPVSELLRFPAMSAVSAERPSVTSSSSPRLCTSSLGLRELPGDLPPTSRPGMAFDVLENVRSLCVFSLLNRRSACWARVALSMGIIPRARSTVPCPRSPSRTEESAPLGPQRRHW